MSRTAFHINMLYDIHYLRILRPKPGVRQEQNCSSQTSNFYHFCSLTQKSTFIFRPEVNLGQVQGQMFCSKGAPHANLYQMAEQALFERL